MDEEADFANILSQSTIAPRPTWTTSNEPSSPDPWANPFSTTTTDSPTNPFASATSPFGSTSAYIPAPAPVSQGFRLDPESPREEISPYVQKLEEDDRYGRGTLPDPPSVIAAREQEATEAVFTNPYAEPQDQVSSFATPDSPPRPNVLSPVSAQAGPASPPSRKLPSDLIDEDLLAASDPSASLKKAFVKSDTAPRAAQSPTKVSGGKKAYVFTPGKSEAAGADGNGNPKGGRVDGDGASVRQNGKAETSPSKPAEMSVKEPSSSTPKADTAPSAIPLPASANPTPSVSRIPSPLPSTTTQKENPASNILSGASDVFTSTPRDRVAVSPLDGPSPAEEDYGFQSLAIGGSSANLPPAVPPKTGASDSKPSASASATGSRFSGKGWAAVEADDDLFGPGGPSIRSDPWGGGGSMAGDGDGWTDPQVAAALEAGPSQPVTQDEPGSPVRPNPSSPSASIRNGEAQTPSKRKNTMFQIAIGDPTRMGDPVRGYTVYTVRTRTTSPHYRKSEISVLRRFSDFLWLFDALIQNNPGVIVPPMPDKQPFGRFQDQFIETRRQALQRCLGKITSHPILQLDPDLRLFLESDSFALESKNRRLEVVPEKAGLLANWTGPRYFEQDDWFDSRKNFLEALESQLKGLSKSIESASKARLEMAISMGDFADSVSELADSDLGSAMCAALARLSDLCKQEKDVNEDQAKGDVMHLLNMADEYVRFIGSVRLAFAARIKAYHHWQAMEKEVGRMKTMREKMRQQGKLGDRVQSSLAEINEAERRVRDTSVDFENTSKLIKSEFVRFERERVDEFKRIMEKQLDKQILKQKELIGAWEEYHAVVLKMVQKSQGR